MKKKLAVMLCLVLAVAVLAGCAKKAPEATATPAATEAVTDAPAATDTPATDAPATEATPTTNG